MQPAVLTEEGSPTKEPCANIGLSGTADEQSASGTIKSTDAAGTAIHAGPVPLFLVPQTVSAEIHAHGGDISTITIRRTRRHAYAVTVTKTAPRGIPAGDGNAE